MDRQTESQTGHLQNRFDLLNLLGERLPFQLNLGETTFFWFREVPVSATVSSSRFRLFQIMLSIGQGSLDSLLGHLIISRSVEMVRRIYI